MKVLVCGMNTGKPLRITLAGRSYKVDGDGAEFFEVTPGDVLKVVGACCIKNQDRKGKLALTWVPASSKQPSAGTLAPSAEQYFRHRSKRQPATTTVEVA